MKHRQCHNLKNYERKQLCLKVRPGQVYADGVNEALPDFLFIEYISDPFEFIA